ncbi:hypothetical protein HMPREF0044_0779 [Gleimia coleocanis DSM 15436]|uniref:TadE-like protein n=1 Tax=Gleimia coleocanis DSM 15436 TaxID=525245 RepID=C0VZQ1_9ACTO|nr:hypothetical protein [Gleimia coleocanis]EEH63760.1 hypothetical protein HMPREF0044_0779 [Gleimia coleocanis DSM 15436]
MSRFLQRKNTYRVNSESGRAESGEAVIEFIGLAAAILIPLGYLVLTLSQVQASVFACEAAARQTAVLQSQGQGNDDLVSVQVDQIFTDYLGRSAASAQVENWCEPQTCAAGGFVHARVHTAVPLPLLPDSLVAGLGASIPVEAEYAYPIEGLSVEP